MATGYAAYTTGVVARYASASNFLALMVGAPAHTSDLTRAVVVKVVSGTATLLADVTIAVAPTYDASLTARSSGDYLASVNGHVIASGNDAALATGGALATGSIGVIDWYPGSGEVRYIDRFRSSALHSAGAAINLSRALAWQPDGSLETEASGGTYFGYAAGQQRAGVPLLDPSGTNRLLIASADFNPDVAGSTAQTVPLGYTVEHRPAFAIGRH